MYPHYPYRDNYDSEQEYLEAVEAFEKAESQSIDSFVEQKKEERHAND